MTDKDWLDWEQVIAGHNSPLFDNLKSDGFRIEYRLLDTTLELYAWLKDRLAVHAIFIKQPGGGVYQEKLQMMGPMAGLHPRLPDIANTVYAFRELVIGGQIIGSKTPYEPSLRSLWDPR